MPYEEPEIVNSSERSQGRAITSGKAITAFVCGLLSFFCPVVLSLIAIVFGILGLVDVKNEGGRMGGKGLAITGLVLGVLSLVIMPVLGFYAVVKIHVPAGRTATSCKLKQIALTFHTYHDRYKSLPPAAVYSKDGRPLYSWRVLVLPYMGDDLYKLFHLDEPWDSPHNKQFLKRMPNVYLSPFDPEGGSQGLTHYQVFVSDDSEPGPRPPYLLAGHADPRNLEPFGPDLPNVFVLKTGKTTFGQVSDGLSNTIFVADAATSVPWTKPEDLVYSSRAPLPPLARHGDTSPIVALGDGSVRGLDLNRISEKTLRNAITMNDNEILGSDWGQ